MSGEDQAAAELADAVECLYVTFWNYLLRTGFDQRCSPLGCRQELARALAGQPLRSVRVEDLAIYAFKATLTMGDEEDFKHFLPRMLELHALEPEWHRHPTNVFPKLAKLNWRQWPRAEQQAIEVYLRALWSVLVDSFPGVMRSNEFFSDLRLLGIGPDSFLQVWRIARSDAGIRRVAEFVTEYLSDPRAFGDAAPRIDDWLVANKLEDELEQAFFRHVEAPWAEELATAVDWFRWRRV